MKQSRPLRRRGELIIPDNSKILTPAWFEKKLSECERYHPLIQDHIKSFNKKGAIEDVRNLLSKRLGIVEEVVAIIPARYEVPGTDHLFALGMRVIMTLTKWNEELITMVSSIKTTGNLGSRTSEDIVSAVVPIPVMAIVLNKMNTMAINLIKMTYERLCKSELLNRHVLVYYLYRVVESMS